MPYAIEHFDFSGYDLVLSSSNFIAKGLVAPPNVPHLSYTHTRQRLAWDLESEYVSAVPAPLRIFAQAYMQRLRAWDKVAAQRVGQYIANSAFVADRLQQLYRRDSVVIHPPFDPAEFSPLDVPRGDYYLAIGRLVNYKRFDIAIEACKLLRRPLRIIGEGPGREHLQVLADGQVQFLGTLSHAEIREQLAGARALLFGGLEDFGLVLVEAQAMGSPVIAYRAGGALETVRDGETGVLFNDQTPASMAAAMQHADNLKFDAPLLRANAMRFSTENFKTRLSDLISKY
jgi:glycosyltransferase involved in cell wall biosynthesis